MASHSLGVLGSPCSPHKSTNGASSCGVASWSLYPPAWKERQSIITNAPYKSVSISSTKKTTRIVIYARKQGGGLNVMISGAPASGKGTQCEMIKDKYNLVHISAGDLLRAEVAADTDYGKRAKEFMNQGKLVPDDVVVSMVKQRLQLPDVCEAGWLLDGYPRSLSQAQALEALKIRPQLFILLEVPEDVLIERVVGRRLDPVTGKIYHLKYFPPEDPEVAARLIQRSDDTEKKAMERLRTYHENLASVLSVYESCIKTVDGNRPKSEVFGDISSFLDDHIKAATKVSKPKQDSWRGMPTKLNSIPHSREIREYFYTEVCEGVRNAVEDGLHKLKVEITIPELNPEMDVYRAGTLLELVRELAFTFANDGKRVKVCVQGPMGEGIFRGMPLQLSGSRRMLEVMDWGDYGAKGTFVNIGAIAASDVFETDDMFILMAPQNAVGNCIIEDLQAMVQAAGDRPVILVNPQLKDVPGAGGVMQVIGREQRMEFSDSFFVCYSFRLLYRAGTFYPIMGALRMKYPGPYEVHKRIDTGYSSETYIQEATFAGRPTPTELQDVFAGRSKEASKTKSIWSFFGI
ncbi:hypothetical protein SELMODRAFT_169443 [Selaginella moellendorffii]|uniref:adenylate kinase n=1 Tax=Selaginella moellendorffii TaxID=88036 RepID=D8R8W9_SELML|nr:probable adenylate kinase 5, chloroplastic isoform X1 [Selaginella moellendorffii]EFJ31312.1 hypothetical protein SELMODRAFT_169443 [Selaginella moellendorffii]|eukprot:XP_002967965.1 probable adenylate kinase 5, chloroplastic isoform X1 [Selaginella moellendorffii]